jgi:hypothetical protein
MKLNRALIISDVAIMKLAPEMNRLTFLREFFSDEVRYLRNVEITEQFSSNTLNRALVEVIRSPFTAWSLLDWAVDQLPTIWRDYRQPPIRRKRSDVTLLTYARLVSMVLVLFALAKAIGGAAPLNGIVTQFVFSLGSSWWAIVLLASCTTIILWWIIESFVSRDR